MQTDHRTRLDRGAALRNRIASFGLTQDYLELLVLFVFVLWMCINWTHTLEAIVSYYTPLPIWDYWRTVINLPHYFHLDFSVLWMQHNEHRIVFPELVYIADYFFFKGLQIFPTVVSTCCYIAVGLILFWAFQKSPSVPLRVKVGAAILAGTIMGWQGCAFVLADTFLLQWTLMQAAGVFALALLTLVPSSRRSPLILIFAIASAVVAEYSSGNGLVIWPVLLLAGVCLSLRRNYLITIALSGAFFIGIYFVGYRFSGATHPGQIIAHPLYFIGFVASYISMPFGVIRRWNVPIGIGQLALLAILLAIAARRRLLGKTPAIVLFGSCAITLLTVAVTAAGRMDPSDPTFFSAKAARYLSVPLANWASVLLAAVWLSCQLKWKIVTARRIIFVAIVLTFVLFPKFRMWIGAENNVFATSSWAALGVESHMEDPQILYITYPDPAIVKAFLPALQRGNYSIYALPYTKWLGRPATNVFRFISNAPQSGEVTQIEPLESGLAIVGWTDGPRRVWHPQRFVFLNQDHVIVGLGEKLPDGLPLFEQSLQTPQSLAWAGFVSTAYNTKTISTYLIDRRGRFLIPIGQSFAPPPVTLIPCEELGPPVINVTWKASPSWTLNGVPFLTQPNKPTGPIYGSWSGSDGNVGSLVSSPMEAPPAGCLEIPVLHGPSIGGLSLKAVDAQNGETLVSVPLRNFDTIDPIWQYWRLSLPPIRSAVKIVAEDNGNGWGQWLAVGEPHYCR